jgi:lactoylglutathione lyase
LSGKKLFKRLILESDMQIARSGIILYVEHYDQCVSFYRDQVLLPVEYVKETLTCFTFGTSYLMVEQDGVASSTEKMIAQNPTVLRFNVSNVKAAADELRARSVAVEELTFDWGEIGVFVDPDGNRCELKNPV